MLYSVNFHYGANYGAYLEAFALCGKFNISVIDFIPGFEYFVQPRGKKMLPFFWRFIAIIRWMKYRLRFPFRVKKFPEFNRFTKTKRIASCGKIHSIDFSLTSAFIAGSDQIWNPGFISQQEQIYFIGFGPDNAKRISYAASSA